MNIQNFVRTFNEKWARHPYPALAATYLAEHGFGPVAMVLGDNERRFIAPDGDVGLLDYKVEDVIGGFCKPAALYEEPPNIFVALSTSQGLVQVN